MSAVERLRAMRGRLRLRLSRRRAVDDVTEELESHLELLTERYMRDGLERGQAAVAARRQLGNTTRVREDVYTMNGVAWLDAVAADLRYACRNLAQRPGFALAAVITVALGIGATTAIFSAVHAVLLKPLPFADADRIYSAEIVIPERREQIPSVPASIQTYLVWRTIDSAFSGMSALRAWEINLTGDGEPERLGGARVSANFFSFLGVTIPRGRGFGPEEEQAGNDRVVVISDGLWRRRYGADPALVGRAILINGESHQVVGIAPSSLRVPTGNQLHPLVPFASRIDVWRPIAPTAGELRNESWDHGVLVRLAPDQHLEVGRQQLESALNALVAAQLPNIKTAPFVQLVPVREIFASRIRARLLMVLGAAVLLLLTACAAIANLLLARVITRAHEFATRLALGASRARLVSLTLSEAAIVTLAGGSIGVAIAAFGARGLAAYGPEDVRALAEPGVNIPMLTFAIAASVVTALACGIYPAWRASRSEPAVTLQDAGRTSFGGRRAGRLQRVLVGAEMALATALLVSAGLLLQSFAHLMRADRGYAIDNVITADLSLFGDRYAESARRIAFYRDLADRIRALAGVSAAGLISDLPAVASSTGASRTILLPTDPLFEQIVLERPIAAIRSVTSGYFAASGTTLRAGRFLHDEEAELTAVISESLARRLWPAEEPQAAVGRQVRQGNTKSPLITIVGVVQDARPGALDREPLPVVYRPYAQWSSGPMTLVARVATDPAVLGPLVRSTIRNMDADLPILAVRMMSDVVSSTVGERRFQMALTSIFALLSLLLGAVGLYGVVNYAVASSSRDIGLRVALGARRGDVIRWVVSQGMVPALIGLIVGLSGAIALATSMRSLLFDVAPADPLVIAVVSAVLLLTAGMACALPARRAARLDAVVTLRLG
jgi:putative ABC transport system permease protein